MNEIWKDVPDYEGLYQASNLGRVKSLNRITPHGHKLKSKFLYNWVRPDGYIETNLCKNNKANHYLIHRLVWSAFNGKISKGMEINHKNGIKQDNRLNKLELVTPSENEFHAYKTGLKIKGENHVNAKLKDYEVVEIRYKYYFLNIKPIILANIFNVSAGHIRDIINNKKRIST